MFTKIESETTTYAPPCDDGICSHENAGHAPGSYEASARAFFYAAIGFALCLVAAIVWAWVRS